MEWGRGVKSDEPPQKTVARCRPTDSGTLLGAILARGARQNILREPRSAPEERLPSKLTAESEARRAQRADTLLR